jgi:hypothetical protein
LPVGIEFNADRQTSERSLIVKGAAHEADFFSKLQPPNVALGTSLPGRPTICNAIGITRSSEPTGKAMAGKPSYVERSDPVTRGEQGKLLCIVVKQRVVLDDDYADLLRGHIGKGLIEISRPRDPEDLELPTKGIRSSRQQ